MKCIRERAKEWQYVAEGNATLVVGYKGTQPLFLTGESPLAVDPPWVLRLSKTSTAEKVITVADYGMDFLIGSAYILPMAPVELSQEFLEQLMKQCSEQRPSHRQPLTHLQSLAYITTDLTRYYSPAPTLVVEIKITCRYCMHAHLRQCLSNYCPLDLYSSLPQRRQKAFTNLFDCENNHLRFFENGQQASVSSLDSWFGKNYKTTWAGVMDNLLTQDKVLSKLKSLQRSLDPLDIEGIFPLYIKWKEHLHLDIKGWIHVIRHYLHPSPLVGEALEKQQVYEYVLSMILKDCSIMVVLSYPNSDPHVFSSQKTVSYQYLKPIDKIPYWYDLDQIIVKNAIHSALKRLCYE
ncbi:inositol-pentakisphosphate 2-kinase [Spinellus fusiger]|nr:inositol-pentakisphosphate 2-kinase [Spinellus fusiger]